MYHNTLMYINTMYTYRGNKIINAKYTVDFDLRSKNPRESFSHGFRSSRNRRKRCIYIAYRSKRKTCSFGSLRFSAFGAWSIYLCLGSISQGEPGAIR